MSVGNAGACIGLVNTSKQGPIATYVQDVGTLGVAGPESTVNYIGTNGNTAYDSNVIGEAVAGPFTVPANDAAAAGKVAQWVTNTALLAAGTTKVTIAAGVVTADNATGTHAIFIAIPAAGLAANKFFWAFEL